MIRACFLVFAGLMVLPALGKLHIGMWPLDKKRDRYMVFEPIDYVVSIENVSPNDFPLSNPEGVWLDFIVKRLDDGRTMNKEYTTRQQPVLLRPRQVYNLQVNLSTLFTMRDPGRYQVTAVIKAAGQPQLVSKPVYVYLDVGTNLWRDQRPVGESTLTYNLISFRHRQGGTRLYLQVEDIPNNLVLSTRSLGPYTKVINPKAFFDDGDNLHVLHTIGMGSYGYSRISARGDIQNQKIFESEPQNPPRLRKHPDGSVLVYGGFAKDKDLERPTLSENQQAGQDEAPDASITSLRLDRPQADKHSQHSEIENSESFEQYLRERGIDPSSTKAKGTATRQSSKGH
ncbi:MAG: hypothetical protein AAGK14_09995 [Verrucomicrobiota bacterium]